jgi:SAM-dependent methyltransferase
MEKLTEFFKNKRVKTALDVGTGTGDFIAVLKNALPDAKITGVDPSTVSIEKAVGKYPEVIFKEMSGEELLFPDNSFDFVAISMALHHLPHIPKTLAEMQRVVKPGGWIVVNELFSDNLNPAQEVHKQYHHFRSITDRILGVSHNETFKKQEIIDFVTNSGVEVLCEFEFKKEGSLIKTPKDLLERIAKMEAMLDKIVGHPEYENLKSQISDFSEKAKQFGFEMATRVVVIGTKI